MSKEQEKIKSQIFISMKKSKPIYKLIKSEK